MNLHFTHVLLCCDPSHRDRVYFDTFRCVDEAAVAIAYFDLDSTAAAADVVAVADAAAADVDIGAVVVE